MAREIQDGLDQGSHLASSALASLLLAREDKQVQSGGVGSPKLHSKWLARSAPPRLPGGKRGGAIPLQTVILATSEPLSALGRAGKPQFITKMENDTSPRSAPGEGLIYDCARAWDIRQSRALRTPSAGALIAVLLATGVKDALRMGYLLLFIIKARQPSSRAASTQLGPACLWSSSLHLQPPPSP